MARRDLDVVDVGGVPPVEADFRPEAAVQSPRVEMAFGVGGSVDVVQVQ